MGSASSTTQGKKTSSQSDKNGPHINSTTRTAGLVHGDNSDLNTEPDIESKEKMAAVSDNKTKMESHPGKAVQMAEKPPDKEDKLDKKGPHKSIIPVASTDPPAKDQNHNVAQVTKESVSKPRREHKIISKLEKTLKRLDDGSLRQNLTLMEWLGKRIQDLDTKVQPSGKDGGVNQNKPNQTDHAQSNADDGVEGVPMQNTADWSKTNKEIKDLKSTKQELLNTVSEIAGARLKNNNPAIADLSDKNRASKLAERFSELYDNEWTDVVEVLRTPNDRRNKKAEQELEEKCIHFMVGLVKVTYDICQKKAREDLIEMINIVVKSTENSAVNVDVSKRCKDFMKLQMSSGEESLEKVIKLVGKEVDATKEGRYSDFYKTLKGNKHYDRYRRSCIELCWYMCLQDPPVSMMADITPKSTKDHFRAYTRSGQFLGFVVWPALRLHENGPLLYKGVAQYTNDEPVQVPPGDSSDTESTKDTDTSDTQL